MEFGRRWGRFLTFLTTASALLLGLLWIGLGDWEAIDLVLGLGQILYGILAIFVLAKNGAEFSRPNRAGE